MEEGKYYHIYNRGINREVIFKEEKNYQFFLQKYDQYLTPLVETYCYCLMPTHFHLFVRIREGKQEQLIIKAFKDFFISYAKAMNKVYGRTGSLFQNKFKKKEIEDDAYFSMIIAYLHLNPTRAGLVDRMDEWKYSSYRTITSGQPTRICRDEVIAWFGGLDQFVKFHESFQVNDSIKSLLF